MKKICMIVEDYPPGGGGGGIFTKELSKRLSKKYKITVVSRGKKNSEKIEKEIKVIRFGGNRIEFFAKSINYLIRSPAFDIYHAHGVLAGLIAKKVKLFKKKPIILHLHGFRDKELIGFIKYNIQKEITKLKYDKIISVDKESAKKVRALGIEKENVIIIPGGVDTNKFKPCKRKGGKNIFLFVGRLEKVKNLRLLLKAVKRLKNETKVFEIWIVGTGTEESELKKYCKKNKLNNVKFLGYVDNKKMDKLYSKAKFFILPSLSEGHPISLLEAMASGLPVIVSDICSLSDIMKASKVGFTFRNNNEQDLENKLEKIMSMKKTSLNRMEKNARKYVEKNFLWEKTVKKIERIYSKLT